MSLVKMVHAICPECGEQITVNPETEAVLCAKCGKPIAVKIAIASLSKETLNEDVELMNSLQNNAFDASLKDALTKKSSLKKITPEIRAQRAAEAAAAAAVAAEERKNKGIRGFIKKHKKLSIGIAVFLVLLFIIDIAIPEPEKPVEILLSVPEEYSSFYSYEYTKVQQILESSGYTNISLNPKYELESYLQNNEGKVSSVSIDGKTSFEENEKFKPDVPVVINYKESVLNSPTRIVENGINAPGYTEDIRKLSYTDIEKIFNDAGFTNVSIEIDYDIYFGILASAGQTEKVTIDGYEYYSPSVQFNRDAPVVIVYHELASKEPAEMASESTVSSESGVVDEAPADEINSERQYPIIEGTSYDAIVVKAAEYGMSQKGEDQYFDYNTYTVEYNHDEYFNWISFVYVGRTKDVLYVDINPIDKSYKKNKECLFEIGKLCCASDYQEEFLSWMNSNYGKEADTIINGVDYYLGVATSGKPYLMVNECGWGDWDYAMSKKYGIE